MVLTDGSNYNQWRRAVCNAYFALLKKKGDISRISVESMVNWKYYTEKHTTFSKEFSAVATSKKAKKPKKGPKRLSAPPVRPVKIPLAVGAGMKQKNAKLAQDYQEALEKYDEEFESYNAGSAGSSPSSSSESVSDSSDTGSSGHIVKDDKYDKWLEAVWDHARSDAGKYAKWVPLFWTMIQNSLCESIQEDISGVVMGDIPTALVQIQISLGRLETIDANNLLIQFTASTWADEGKSNWLTYSNHMRVQLNRILAVEPSLINDRTAQCALVHGLKIGPQAIHFAHIIRKYGKGTHAKSFEDLRAKISRHVAEPMILEALSKLRPMTTSSVHFTSADQSPKTKKINELTVLLANASKAASRAPTKVCFDFLKGACTRPSCKFSHNAEQKSGQDKNTYCEFHKNTSHNTKDCRSLIKQQASARHTSSQPTEISRMSKTQLLSYVEQLQAAQLPITISMVVQRHQLSACCCPRAQAERIYHG